MSSLAAAGALAAVTGAFTGSRVRGDDSDATGAERVESHGACDGGSDVLEPEDAAVSFPSADVEAPRAGVEGLLPLVKEHSSNDS